MKLFDEIKRDYNGPAQYAEGDSVYLNRSARVSCERIRATLEGWFSRYPQTEQAELRARFRSTDNFQHLSAFFEIFLHEILLKLDCTITIHPHENGQGRRPDFFVNSPDGTQFFVEAVLATGESMEETAARARKNQVYDVLNRLDSPNFFIGMDMQGAPDTSPPGSRIRKFLSKELSLLDPDEVSERYNAEGEGSLPRWHFELEGWIIDFFPIPKKAEARGKTGNRPIGAQTSGMAEIDSVTPIRNAILSKSGCYGDFEIPYIIAVCALDTFAQKEDVIQALFGDEKIRMKVFEGGKTECEPIRVPNGVWMNEGGPVYTRVSGVIVALKLSPWQVSKSEVNIYHNPWAQRPYKSVLNNLPQMVVKNNVIESIGGQAHWEILDIGNEWPDQ